MNFSKSLVAILASAVILSACGNSGDAKSGSKDSTTTTAAPANNAAADKALEMIAASDCTTCHRLNKNAGGATTGPAYSDVAAKYSPAADTTVDRLVKKIVTGGSGVWGSVPMTPHPALKEADIRTMVTYILSLKN